MAWFNFSIRSLWAPLAKKERVASLSVVSFHNSNCNFEHYTILGPGD